MTYYVIEHQKRPDGVVNVSEVARSTYASAQSYYHERYSKMVMTELYTKVALMMVDENLSVIQQTVIETQYKPAAEAEN